MSTSLSKAEKSYIKAGLALPAPQRADGRSLPDFRTVALETGVASLANGSARVSIGRNVNDNGGGTEVLAATKLEVENVGTGEGVDGGRFVITVSCSPAAYPHLSSNALDDLQYDLTTILNQTLSHPSLHPKNLGILPNRKSWLLNLDMIALSDSGNIFDALFMAARAALWDTKVPRTRGVEYKAKKNGANTTSLGGDMDVDETTPSGFDTRQLSRATDFELPDYWDEGEVLDGRERWPVCITMNLAPPVHFLDATPQEEAAVPLKLLLIFSFPSPHEVNLQSMRMLGPGELAFSYISGLIEVGQKRAQELHASLELKLKDEDVRRNQKARDKFAKR